MHQVNEIQTNTLSCAIFQMPLYLNTKTVFLHANISVSSKKECPAKVRQTANSMYEIKALALKCKCTPKFC